MWYWRRRFIRPLLYSRRDLGSFLRMYDALLNELGVDKSEVFSWPVTVVVKNGDGYQVTGPNSVYFVKRIVDGFVHPEKGPQVTPGI